MANIPLRIKQAEVTVDVGSLTVNTTPPTPEALTSNGNKYTGAVPTIPAGCSYVYIKNMLGETGGDITINGITYAPGQTFIREPFYQGNKLKTLPQYAITNLNGALVEVYYET